jgi:hypothetical protein
LSPLLANVLLDEVDKELEKRGHAFCRYADDCNVYVRSRRAGERVMGLLRQLYAGLRLRVNEAKSTVGLAWNRKILSYIFWVNREGTVKRAVADKALATMKDKVRDITKRTGGQSIGQVGKRLGEYLRGWKEYFRLADTPRVFGNLEARYCVAARTEGIVRHVRQARRQTRCVRGERVVRVAVHEDNWAGVRRLLALGGTRREESADLGGEETQSHYLWSRVSWHNRCIGSRQRGESPS